MSYKFSFRSQKLKKSDYELIFKEKDSPDRRKTLRQIIYLTKTYGVGVAVLDSVLQILNGYVFSYGILDYKEMKHSFIIKIPYLLNTKIPKNRILRLSGTPVFETPLTVKWPPKPLKIQSNESQKLDTQIKIIKEQRRQSRVDQRIIERCSDIAIRNKKCRSNETDEESDVSDKIKNYVCSGPFLTGNSHVLSSTFSTTHSYRTSVSLPDQPTDFKTNQSSPDQQEDVNGPNMHLESSYYKPETPESITNPTKQSFKVMIVDDVLQQRALFKKVLNELYKVESDIAKDGLEGVQLYQDYAKNGFIYQVIFMDVYMPQMDGIAATQRIRDIEKDLEAPRTFICGMSGDSDLKERCKECGMDEFRNFYVVIKPPNIKDITKIIETVQQWYLGNRHFKVTNHADN